MELVVRILSPPRVNRLGDRPFVIVGGLHELGALLPEGFEVLGGAAECEIRALRTFIAL